MSSTRRPRATGSGRRQYANQAEALDATVKLLESTGKLEHVDAAVIQLARGLAKLLDEGVDVAQKDGTVARVDASAQHWREYRAALAMLLDGRDGGTDALTELASRLQTEVGHR